MGRIQVAPFAGDKESFLHGLRLGVHGGFSHSGEFTFFYGPVMLRGEVMGRHDILQTVGYWGAATVVLTGEMKQSRRGSRDRIPCPAANSATWVWTSRRTPDSRRTMWARTTTRASR